jgi:hypothetical protein
MKNEKKQTAVEWLFNEITLQYVAKGNLSFMDIVNMSQQAKEIEKEQIKIAYYNGTTDQIKTKDELLLEAEHYYNESFGGMGQ